MTGGVDDDEAFYTDHLAGFVIVNSRDKGGGYESVALLRTAAAWLCRGVARRLLAEAVASADLIRNPAHRTHCVASIAVRTAEWVSWRMRWTC